jgi:hypothetical protein
VWQGAQVAMFVDDCLWTWNGRRWCHLVSDTDLAELHAFAAAVGLPSRAFHADHYDVPAELRGRVLDAGAMAVSSRELLRRLRESGLRVRPSARRAPGNEPAEI